MTEQLSRETARWKYNGGEDALYLQLDEKTPEALLQFDIAYMCSLRSIGGRGWSHSFGNGGLASEIPLCDYVYANPDGKNVQRQYLTGSLSGALSLTCAHATYQTSIYFDEVLNYKKGGP